jgi:hypothetical protein
MTQAVRAGLAPASSEVTLPARPEALTVKPAETAVIVVDMQNAYATQGGYVDLAVSTSQVRQAPSRKRRRLSKPRAPPAFW